MDSYIYDEKNVGMLFFPKIIAYGDTISGTQSTYMPALWICSDSVCHRTGSVPASMPWECIIKVTKGWSVSLNSIKIPKCYMGSR